MTFKSLIFGICRAAMFLVLKSVDSYKKIISWQASLCFTTYPIFCLKNKFVPLLARRGSKLRCCEKLHVGQHWVLQEWNQTNGIKLLHDISTKSNINTASPFFSVISSSVLIYIHLPPSHPFTFPNSKIGSGKAQIFNTFTILVLTISISKRIFCLLLASLKKLLERREICRKGIHRKYYWYVWSISAELWHVSKSGNRIRFSIYFGQWETRGGWLFDGGGGGVLVFLFHMLT